MDNDGYGLLVLTRNEGERIFIGEPHNGTIITLVRGQSQFARIGVQAPSEVKIQREELVTDPSEKAAWNAHRKQ